MKKAMAAALTAVILIAGIFVVNSFVRQKPSSVSCPSRPEDRSLEFWICDDATKIDWSGHEEISGWFGAREYLGAGYRTAGGERPLARVSYILTAWPDYSDGGSYITQILITDPAVSVYGLTVDSLPEEFEEVMESMGYKVEQVSGGLRAVKGDFTFSLRAGDEYNVPELRIRASVTNCEGIVF